ncbi:unnamed protein product [Musa hybrid cultivar]
MTTLCIPKEESEGHENALKSFGERDVRAWNPIRSFRVGEKERKELGKGKRGGAVVMLWKVLLTVYKINYMKKLDPYMLVEGIPCKWPTLEQPSHSEDHQGVGMRKWRKLQDSVDDLCHQD